MPNFTQGICEADKAKVKTWMQKLQTEECPYDEAESYYSRSSHSSHDKYFDFLRRRILDNLYNEALRDENPSDHARQVCAHVELCFQLGYVKSSLYWCIHHERQTWFHSPDWGLKVTFNDLLKNDSRVPLGRCLTHEQFVAHNSVQAVAVLRDKMPKGKMPCRPIAQEMFDIATAALQKALDELSAMIS